jgi:hypothetical protein
MSRQNLAEREAAIALDELTGKLSIYRIRDHLKAKGFICVTPEEAVEQIELEMARDYLQSARRYREKTDNVQLEFVNLYELTDNGERVNYYRKFSELTVEEGAQLLAYCHRHKQHWEKQYNRYWKPLHTKYGRRLQKLLPFAAPMKSGPAARPMMATAKI